MNALAQRSIWTASLLSTVVFGMAFASATETETAQQVRSLLSNNCFACHGPDESKREGGLRLDDRQALFAPADSGDIPIVANEPEKSELLRRIRSKDNDERMPPPKFGAQLAESDLLLIERWIREGAALDQHWSFVPPTRPKLSELKLPDAMPAVELAWKHHPVDQFVLAKQLSLGMHPSHSATKAELLRRLSLDLTGLPPTLEQVVRFELDATPDAFINEVDRLLASPAYGEHWARKWLDLARYADSAGYADDPPHHLGLSRLGCKCNQ